MMSSNSAISGILPKAGSRRGVNWARLRHFAPLYLMVLPTVVMLLVFFYYPAINGFLTSFQYVDVRGAQWVGLDNYERLFNDVRLIQSFRNLIFLAVFNVGVVISLPLLVAALIFRVKNLSAQYWWRIVFVIPIVVPAVASILVWRWMYSADGGLNILLSAVGLGDLTRSWLGDRDVVMWALAFTNFPWVAGINFLIYYAGLQDISQEVLDASVVDGATSLRRFLSIELPLLRPQMRLLVLLTLIYWMRSFELPMIMTNGGPGFATMVPGLRMYYAINRDFDLGYGSAIGTILFLIVLVITLIQLRLTRTRDDVI
ncbi:MAG: sugar ABC transporter permease [Anaerolineae bacterium]|nr:sugar ABC transporter permease [Anaerolineae bacterium]NUQ03028.1 sugar ABC transporter permease [Anaerolineae bacterium]